MRYHSLITVHSILDVQQSHGSQNHSISVVFLVEEVSVTETRAATLSPIHGEDAEIIIPIREVLVGLEGGAKVRMAALLFRNMSGLLPDRIGYEDR